MIIQFLYFNLLWKFSWDLWNIVSRRITESGKFQTFSGKVEINAQPVDQSGWIKFRGPINGVKLPAKFQLCKSFQLLTIARQSFSFGAPFRSHQEFSWPQKNSEGLLWPPPPVCQILSQKINIKCLKSAGKKTPKRHNLDMAALKVENCS
jgi:hypothetical protein